MRQILVHRYMDKINVLAPVRLSLDDDSSEDMMEYEGDFDDWPLPKIPIGCRREDIPIGFRIIEYHNDIGPDDFSYVIVDKIRPLTPEEWQTLMRDEEL